MGAPPAAPLAAAAPAPTAPPAAPPAVRRLLPAGALSWSAELSGSLGDLGTFMPLVVALAATIQLDLGTTLLLSGLYNIVSGLSFQIPMCVQPMKTIAAVALASPGLRLPEVMAAGLFVAGAMLVLGLTGAMNWLNRAVPGSIVRGIQLAVGLQLAQKGVAQIFQTGEHSYRQLWGVEGCVLGLCAATFLLVTTLPASLNQPHQHQQQYQPVQQQHQHDEEQAQQQEHAEGELEQQQQQAVDAADPACSARGCSSSTGSSGGVPSALIVVVLGLLLAVIAAPQVVSELRLGPSRPHVYVPSWQEWKDGVTKAGVAQLPLTSLNSAVAVSHLALELFPERAAAQGWRWRPSAVAVSVGAMNLVGCWFGAFPSCHGSGGLAAQYKFGARTGCAPVLLGCIKAALALLFGSSLLQLLQHFPQPLLGALLLLAGLELASTAARKEAAAAAVAGGGHWQDQRGHFFMLLTAAAIAGLRNTAAGFAVGLGGVAAAWLFEAVRRWWCAA